MTSKIKSISKVRIEGTKEKEFFNYMSRPKKNFEPYPDPKNSPLGPQKLNKVDSGRARSSGPIIKIRIGLFGVFCNFSLDNCAQLNVVE